MPAQRSRPELFLKKRVLDACYRSWESLNVFLDKLLRRAARRYYQKQARRMRREVLLSHSELARLMTARSVPVIEPDWLQQLVECILLYPSGTGGDVVSDDDDDAAAARRRRHLHMNSGAFDRTRDESGISERGGRGGFCYFSRCEAAVLRKVLGQL